jgi:hypothetical protein
MTDTPNNVKGNKYEGSLYRYIGPENQWKDMLFVELAPFKKEEKWKYDLGERDCFMTNIAEDHLQPPHFQRTLSKVSDSDPSDRDSELTLSEGPIGGVLFMGTQEEKKKHFKRLGNPPVSPSKG